MILHICRISADIASSVGKHQEKIALDFQIQYSKQEKIYNQQSFFL